MRVRRRPGRGLPGIIDRPSGSRGLATPEPATDRAGVLRQGVRFHPRTGRWIRTLPTLFIPLRGEVAIDLRACSDVERGNLVPRFEDIPDAAVSHIQMDLGRR
jgi:hypothetical protein